MIAICEGAKRPKQIAIGIEHLGDVSNIQCTLCTFAELCRVGTGYREDRRTALVPLGAPGLGPGRMAPML